MTTDITELAQSLKAAANREMVSRDLAETSRVWQDSATPENILALVEALEKARQRIEELESDLSEWTDCKHDGATYYGMSGQERCGRCGADI
ncbi:TPA: hypothetical protein ACTW6Y_004726 [Klebsiella pneumoniae]|uniref:hypothetical protein n=1 Tax=Klebsiella sp. GG_Kp156 TaxID=3153467 RepID=UPI0032B4EF85|nr:hypothetical protein [Klebsiella quasipneumoniae]